MMSLPSKEKTTNQATNNKEKHKNKKEQSHDVPLMYLSTTPMHLPRLWTDAPVAKSRSREEQNSKGSKGSTQGPQQTQRKSEKEKPTKNHEKEGARWGNHRRGRRVGRGGQGGEGCTHHIRIAKVQLSGA